MKVILPDIHAAKKVGPEQRLPFKASLAKWTSPFFVNHFWRLTYFVLSYVLYYQILGPLHWGLHPDNNDWLIEYPDQLWEVITVIHLGSIALLYTAFLQSDFLEFIGLRQAWRGLPASGSTTTRWSWARSSVG